MILLLLIGGVKALPTLGKRLKNLRKQKRWTLQEVADKLELRGHSTYSNWEYDRTEPDSVMLARIADLYGVSLNWLHGRDEKEHAEYTLPKSEMDFIIAEAEAHYNVNLRDDPVVLAAVKQMIELLAKAKSGESLR